MEGRGSGDRVVGGEGGIPIVVPDLRVTSPLRVSLWLVAEGSPVLAGDRIVELLAGAATVDLEAPVAGRLARCLVDEDEIVGPGSVLAEILPQVDR